MGLIDWKKALFQLVGNCHGKKLKKIEKRLSRGRNGIDWLKINWKYLEIDWNRPFFQFLRYFFNFWGTSEAFLLSFEPFRGVSLWFRGVSLGFEAFLFVHEVLFNFCSRFSNNWLVFSINLTSNLTVVLFFNENQLINWSIVFFFNENRLID